MAFFRKDGAELFFEVQGSGETILFLHGLGTSAWVWRSQTAAFSPRYQVVVMDVRGSGRSHSDSTSSGPLSITWFAEDAAALLRHLGVKSAHVVGLSMGGMIAFELALRAPALVRSLTIVNSGPDGTPGDIRHCLGIAARYIVTRLFGPGAMGVLLAPILFPQSSMGPIRSEFCAQLRCNDENSYLATVRAILGWSALARLGEITAPALVITADRDYTPAGERAAYVQRMRDARLVVVRNAGHALPMEAPERFNHHLERFLEGISSCGFKHPRRPRGPSQREGDARGPLLDAFSE
ncbi:MAG: alpha/beta hydrolase [Microthrixaceae bacterium]